MAADNEFWTETPEVVRLFPTFVWRCQLRPEIHRPINTTILNQLDAMRYGQPPLERGVAWQSDPLGGGSCVGIPSHRRPRSLDYGLLGQRQCAGR